MTPSELDEQLMEKLKVGDRLVIQATHLSAHDTKAAAASMALGLGSLIGQMGLDLETAIDLVRTAHQIGELGRARVSAGEVC